MRTLYIISGKLDEDKVLKTSLEDQTPTGDFVLYNSLTTDHKEIIDHIKEIELKELNKLIKNPKILVDNYIKNYSNPICARAFSISISPYLEVIKSNDKLERLRDLVDSLRTIFSKNPYYLFPLRDYDYLIIQKCFDKITDPEIAGQNYNELILRSLGRVKLNGQNKISNIRIIAHKNDISEIPEKKFNKLELEEIKFIIKSNSEIIDDKVNVMLRTFSHLQNDSPISYSIVNEVVEKREIDNKLKERLDALFEPIKETYSYVFDEMEEAMNSKTN